MQRSSVANPVSSFFLKVGRRQRRRVEIDAEVRITPISAEEGEMVQNAVTGRTVNLSNGGALLVLPETDGNGEAYAFCTDPSGQANCLIDAEFHYDNDGPGLFNALAKVVWLERLKDGPKSEPYVLAGIKFIKLYQEDRQRLEALLGD